MIYNHFTCSCCFLKCYILKLFLIIFHASSNYKFCSLYKVVVCLIVFPLMVFTLSFQDIFQIDDFQNEARVENLLFQNI